MRRPRILAIATHPIQYQVPWYQALARIEKIDFAVLYCQLPDAQQQGVGFGVAFEWDIPLLEGYRWRRVPALCGRGGLRGFFSAHIRGAKRLLREHAPDVLILTGWHAWPLVQVVIIAAFCRIPVIMRGESNALRGRPLVARIVHRTLLAACSAFLTIGKSNRDFYSRYGVPEHRLFTAPYFVDNVRFERSVAALGPRRAELRAGWGIPNDSVCFCFAGKLERKKRILDLLEALRKALAETGATIHLLIVGTGELMPQARAYVEEHRLPVTFAGFLNQSEIARAYSVSDCLVLPSDHGETWGLVVNEAMACGLPAIVSDRVGCGPDLIRNGVTGIVFPFSDVHALAETLKSLAEAPEHLRQMGANARTLIKEYSVEHAVIGTTCAISHVLRSGR